MTRHVCRYSLMGRYINFSGEISLQSARQRGVEPLREVRSRLVVDGSIFDIFYHG